MSGLFVLNPFHSMVDERPKTGAVRRLERWENDGHSRRRVHTRNRMRDDVLPVYRPVGARREGRQDTESSRDERGRRKRRAEWGAIEPYSRWQAADHEDDVVLVRPLERRNEESPQVAEEVAKASDADADKRLAATVAKARAVADELAKKQIPVSSAPEAADQTRDDDYMSASFIITENDDKAERLRRRKKADQQKPNAAGKQANAQQPQAQAAFAQYYYSPYYAQQYYYGPQPYANAHAYDPRYAASSFRVQKLANFL